MKKHLIVITGPTASGKSALAVDVAEALGTEIINADSRQVYSGLPVVTAMPSAEERARVKHHLVDFLPLDAYYSAAEFERDALKVLENVMATRDMAVVCGGSMMYVDALCHGIDDIPTVPPELRTQLADEYQHYGDSWLRMRLLALDPVHYEKVDLNNMARVFHAVEVSIAAGKPYSSLLGQARPKHDYRVSKFMLSMPREMLFQRINERVYRMAENGAVDEVRNVSHLRHLNSLNTVGVKELLKYIDGDWTLDFALARMAKNTRVYAKKQMTWFKRDESIKYLDVNGDELINQLLTQL